MTSAISLLAERPEERSQDGPRDHRRLRILRRAGDAIHPASPRPQRRDCQGRLLAALEAMAGPGMSVEQATVRPWCSATFLGAQHRLTLRIDGPDATKQARVLASGLGEAEFSLRGHIVADVTVDEVRADGENSAVIALAVLTIEDW